MMILQMVLQVPAPIVMFVFLHILCILVSLSLSLSFVFKELFVYSLFKTSNHVDITWNAKIERMYHSNSFYVVDKI